MFKSGKYIAIPINNIQTLLIYQDMNKQLAAFKRENKKRKAMKNKEKKYIPFGTEWEKDVMKSSKAVIVQMFKNSAIQCLQLSYIRGGEAARLDNEEHEIMLVKDIRHELLWFARNMEIKLKANDHKGGWERESLQYLTMRLTQERKELTKAINSKDYDGKRDKERIIKECADIANFCMMIADNFNKNLY